MILPRSRAIQSLPTVAALVALLAAAPAAESFLGPIPVQIVTSGTDTVLDMHRFYQPAGPASVTIAPAKGVEAAFDPATFQLHLKLAPDAKGLLELPFKASGQPGLLTLVPRAPVVQEFRFHAGESKPSAIALVGSFNNWDPKKNPLTPGADGVYKISLPLEPGSYTYKFEVDGKLLADPGNPVTSSDGSGGENSVLRLDSPGQANPLGIFAAALDAKTLTIRSTAKIAAQSVAAELPDGSVKPLAAKVTATGLTCPVAGLPAGSSVRVIAADASGSVSNTLLVPISKPAALRWKDAVMYYALTDRFADGDKSNDHPVDNPEVKWSANFHGGDWRGITDKISDGYFEHLGVNTLWIAPLNQNPAGAYQETPAPHRWYTGYHGYWPISPTAVEPHFGDAAALKQLVRTAHEHGIRVIADLVLHHVHTEHPWWREHRDWFGQLDLPDGTKNLRLWDTQQFTTWFEPFLPTFDFDRAEAVAALIDNSAWWANEYDLDGFRLDAVKHIRQSFWWKFRSALRERVEAKRGRPLYLIGETFQDRRGIDSFVGPNMLDGQFDFPLYDSIKETLGSETTGLDSLEASIEASESIYGKEALMSPLIGNHDKGRFMAYADGDLPDPAIAKEEEVGWTKPPTVRQPEAYAKLELAQALLMSLDGVPMIYYGDEIGMTGAGDPDNRRDMRFGDDVTAEERGVLHNFEQLGKIRREHPALHGGSRRALVAEKNLLVFARASLEDRVLCVFNRDAAPLERTLSAGAEFDDGNYTDLLGSGSATVSKGAVTIKVPAHKAAFFVRQPRR